MIGLLIGVPAGAGVLAFVIGSNRLRRILLVAVALSHLGLVAQAWRMPLAPAPTGLEAWLALDPAALLFLSLSSVLFLAAAIYGVGYLTRQHAAAKAEPPTDDDLADDDAPPQVAEAVFTGCLLLFLATMTLVAASRHFGLLWVAVEATTLASAPLIYFHRDSRSLEATWKYLVICSVGIALALLGNFFLAVATQCGAEHVPMTFAALLDRAMMLDPVWLRAAFILLLVGYGTKMGLAPLHTWLPDAHSEAPSMVSALLSGALLNCAWLAILRSHHVLVAAGIGDFSRDLLVLFGLFSMVLGAVFIINQTDFKRMLAYSSVEHMGILALAVGAGSAWAGYGAMLHAANHSLTKGLLFLTAGNILAHYHTKSTLAVRGLKGPLPLTALLWVAGFLAITGSPPFGTFASELTILKGIFDAGRPVLAAAYLVALGAVFVGMATIVLRMVYGENPAGGEGHPPAAQPEPRWSTWPPLALGLAVLTLGVYIPPPLAEVLRGAAAAVGIGG